jgi:hypothetical protein
MCMQGDLRREGVLSKPGTKMWTFPDDMMSLPIMMTSFVVQRLLDVSRAENQELRRHNDTLVAQLEKAGIKPCLTDMAKED